MEKAFFYNKILLQISKFSNRYHVMNGYVLNLYLFVVDAIKLQSINL